MRPLPPEDMIEDTGIRFEPAHDLLDWARSTFIDEGASLLNKDHAHLRFASIGALWTNVPMAGTVAVLSVNARWGCRQPANGPELGSSFSYSNGSATFQTSS